MHQRRRRLQIPAQGNTLGKESVESVELRKSSSAPQGCKRSLLGAAVTMFSFLNCRHRFGSISYFLPGPLFHFSKSCSLRITCIVMLVAFNSVLFSKNFDIHSGM